MRTTKAEWRRWARALPPVDQETTARIASHVTALVATFDGPVLGYVALPDEVAVVAGTVLPRLGDDGTMTLHRDDGRRERHALGIQQPPATAGAVEPGDLAAVLVPGRVFDRGGFRLGRGGGHYDRLLPHLDPDVPVIGVTSEARVVEALPREPHDRPMTVLVTEHGPISTK